MLSIPITHASRYFERSVAMKSVALAPPLSHCAWIHLSTASPLEDPVQSCGLVHCTPVGGPSPAGRPSASLSSSTARAQ